MQKLKIKETKAMQQSTFKTDIIKVSLVFSICNFFINKNYQANNWSAKKIPSCANLALEPNFFRQITTNTVIKPYD